jgi:hypothetical protein
MRGKSCEKTSCSRKLDEVSAFAHTLSANRILVQKEGQSYDHFPFYPLLDLPA